MTRIIIVILSLILWPYFSIFFRELSNLLFAKLVGLNPQLMVVGEGFRLLRKRLFGTIFDLRIRPFSGSIDVYLPDTGWEKFEDLNLKLIIYYLGGLLSHTIFLAFFTILRLNMSDYDYVKKYSILKFFVLEEMILIYKTLFTDDSTTVGGRVPFDLMKVSYFLAKNYRRVFFSAYGYLIMRIMGDRASPQTLFSPGYRAEIKRFMGDQPYQIPFKNDKRSMELYLKADTEIFYGHYDEAIAKLNQLLKGENASEAERVRLLEILSSIVINEGQKQYLTEADGWSREALRLAGYSKTVQGTRGAILIEIGKYEEGKQLLLPLIDPANDWFDRMVSSYYLALADHRLGNREQARGWLKGAEEIGKTRMFDGIKQEIYESRLTTPS